MVRRVNECQCVNTGAILLLRQGMFIDENFSAAINGKSVYFVQGTWERLDHNFKNSMLMALKNP